MKRQGGFTLIELVVVIVILGILAVTAAPKFLNLQGDAREASLKGLAGGINGAAGIVYGKSAVEGEESIAYDADATPATTPDVDGIHTTYGYPTADADGIVAAVQGLGDAEQWSYVPDGDNNALYATFVSDYDDSVEEITGENNNCYVRYTEATDTTADKAYSVDVVTDGCN